MLYSIMRRFFGLALILVVFGLFLSGCDVPKPPPELPTATVGSQNPESIDAVRGTPVRIEPERDFTPLAVPPGTIYFARSSGLWSIEPNGSGEKQLANLPVTSAPVPSPDGTQVAWISDNDLYVVAAGGGEPRKLYSGPLADRQRIGWAPDSSKIGFITLDPSVMGGEKSWYVPAIGGPPLEINSTAHGAVPRGASYERVVQWSPDGFWIVISGVNNPMQIMRWPVSPGKEGEVIEVAGGEPDWSPDSHTLVHTESMNGALQIFDIRSVKATPFRTEQQPVGTGLNEYGQGPGPKWSPASVGTDSDLIAYRSHSPGGEPRVSIRRRGARELAPLPSLTNNPAWSPSGDKLVVETGYLQAGELGPRWVPTGLSIAAIDTTGGDHRITPLVKGASSPAWGK